MFKNYFKTAIRNLARKKGYATINIVGLAVGMAACLLIFLVIQFELSFDNFHRNSNRIYRVVSEFDTPEGKFYSPGVPFPVGEGLRIDHPELKKVARIFGNNNEQITIEEEGKEPVKFIEERGPHFAEPAFFEIFNFKWLAGDPKTALTQPMTGVLTRSTAERYYGDWKTAIGKSFKYDNRDVIKVTGILEDIPANSDFPFTAVISFETLKKMGYNNNLTDWVSTFSQAYCFVVLPDNVSPETFNTQLKSFVKKHKPAEYQRDGLALHPLSEMHFDDRFGNFRGRTFGKDLITALMIIGIFLLIIACVNFINLATAQAVNRSKEVGVRKVLGSNRRQLTVQFLSETALITVFAVLISVLIAYAVLPLLNQLLRLDLSLNIFGNPAILLFLLVSTIVVILLSGFYPAMVLSGFNPITALKSRITPKMVGGISLRRGLVVLQFAIAQVLIIGMMIVVSQMDYFRNASLGFDKEAILNVPVPSDSVSRTKFNALRDQLLQNPGITKLSLSYTSPSDNGNWSSDFKFDHSPKNTDFSASLKWADTAYFSTYGLQFVAGKPYNNADTVTGFVVNEMLLSKLGIRNPDEAIGKEINFWDGEIKANIVGVIKDFHVNSLRDPISPVVLATEKRQYRTLNIKMRADKIKETTAYVEAVWNKTFPDFVYQQQFLDEKINNFYRQENQLSQLYKIFAAIAIFISCLGLYGLVSFMAVQRTKEVGIRKVLGASVGRIVYLFSKEFTLLIGIAFLIAGPVAYYIMHEWLQNFTFRIKLGAGIFLAAIVLSVLIAWLTVGYRAVKAALANPVKSLRTE
ncbi:MAG TPA: ABC transporter permease [Chitinophagaceae bacterium]|nr:ABC transporter permease [Chitinophagaceae bacterium]